MPDFDDDDKDSTKAFTLNDAVEAGLEGRRMTATLTCIVGKAAGKLFKLGAGASIVGRAADAAIVLEDEGVSRKHAKVVDIGGSHILSDLQSTNGTFYNGARVAEPVVLHDGDRIRIGPTVVFKFGYQDELEEKMQAQLYDSATRDPLTQAFNRRYFNERLATEWAWSKRHNTPCALVAIDADHFKRINDTYGHQAGDYVLKELVVTAQSVVRKEDLLARIGGEEFVVLARATSRQQAVVLAERIRVAVAGRMFVYNTQRLPVTVSLGVSTSDDLGVESPDELVGRADEFLYRAKENGRNRVEPSGH